MTQLDDDKVADCHKKLIKVLQKYDLTVGEIILIYGNLGYTLGASIEGYEGTGPSIEELQKLYYAHNKVGYALMLQGALVTTWYDGLKEQETQEDQGEENGST